MNMITENKEFKWYIHFPLEILNNKNLNDNQKIVALVLYSRAHGKNTIDRTMDEISAETGINKNTVYTCIKKLEKISKQYTDKTDGLVKSIPLITITKEKNINGTINIYKLYPNTRSFQMIPQNIYDKFIKTNPKLLINYAKLRHAHWYCSYKTKDENGKFILTGEQSTDLNRYVELMQLRSVDEFNAIQKEIADAGLIQTKLIITFNDGLDDETLQPK